MNAKNTTRVLLIKHYGVLRFFAYNILKLLSIFWRGINFFRAFNASFEVSGFLTIQPSARPSGSL